MKQKLDLKATEVYLNETNQSLENVTKVFNENTKSYREKVMKYKKELRALAVAKDQLYDE